jgi:hypothetical protein
LKPQGIWDRPWQTQPYCVPSPLSDARRHFLSSRCGAWIRFALLVLLIAINRFVGAGRASCCLHAAFW